MLTDHFLQELRQRLCLSTVVGRVVKLVQKGRHFKGLCPFHTEKTPSFVVNDEKGRYHCFGCGVHGDVIDFLCRFEHLSFAQAVKELAHQVGLALPSSQSVSKDKEFLCLLSLMEDACQWFQKHLQPSVIQYLHSRHINAQVIQNFRLGWASGQGLITHLLSLGHTHALMKKGGLIDQRKDGTFYEYFRARLIFPIFNDRLQVIAFGGRVLDQKLPKYLNSPETPLFEKRKVLYGMPSQKHKIVSPLVIVEGYFDVMAMSPYSCVLAPLGTALTALQLTSIWERCAEPIVCFDGDKAGQQAQFKLAMLALSLLKPGFSLFFAHLPPDYDPHSFIQSHGWLELKKCLDHKKSLADFLWQNLFKQSITPEQRAAALAQWKDFIKTIPHADVRYFYEKYFYSQYRAVKKNIYSIPSAPFSVFHQKILLSLLILKPHFIEKVREELAMMTFPHETAWLHIRDYLLCWNGEDSFQSFLHQQLGATWQETVETVYRHVNMKDLPDDHLYAYWIDLFNAYQTHIHKKKELDSLKNDLFVVPHTWDRLTHLTKL